MLVNLPNQSMYMYEWLAVKDLARSVDSSWLYREGLGHMLGHSRPLSGVCWCTAEIRGGGQEATVSEAT